VTVGAALVVAALAAAAPVRLAAQETAGSAGAVVTGIMVHGNHTTPDAEVLQLAGVAIGVPFTSSTIADVTRRLEDSGRFRSVDVRQRYASFSDPSAVLLVLVVEERVGVTLDVPSPGPLRRLGASTMWMPVFGYEDGYGFTYGARISLVDVLGRSTRVSAPLTWGGERRASLLVERTFARGPISRVEVSGGVWRREFPPTGEGQRRDFVAGRLERTIRSWTRIAGRAEVANVSLGATRDRVRSAGVEGVIDTRRDPAFARNAVYVAAAWEGLWFDNAPDTSRATIDARGYLGLPGKAVLVGRVQHVWTADRLPAYEQQLLGGTATLRGFELGYRADDRLTAGSAELRLPLTSPLKLGRFGVAVFADRGAVHATGTRLADADVDTGLGAGFFITLPALSMRVDVAHGPDAGTRGHVSIGARF
jgi:outer membrane protein assembly factor BamA